MATCQACRSESLVEVLDLGEQPICNKFLDDETEFDEETFYPLTLAYCPDCYLAQLTEVPPLDEVFGDDFNYLSGSTSSHVDHFDDLAATISEELGLGGSACVVDIGSNDGTFLECFQKRGIEVLGVEPAQKPADIANRQGIRTLNDRLETSVEEISEAIEDDLGVITAMNVLAHTDDIHGFLNGVQTLLSRNEGAHFISQSHYLPKLIENCEYDTIYHEHARYFSLSSMKSLYDEYDLTIYHVERSDYYGGSIIVYAKHDQHDPQVSESVRSMLSSEKKYKEIRTYEDFSQQVEQNREKLVELLTELRNDGKELVGIGAPMKSSTLLNYCDIDDDYLQYITEVNPLKIGTYTPGTHIEVVEEQRLLDDDPDVGVILSWNVSDSIIDNLREKGYTGDFVIPIPEPKLVTPERSTGER
ncbi:MAG: class I SAM-dependent methyltransferase [Halorhabdus sp.]